MAEKLYNRLIREIKNYHEHPPALSSAYQRALEIDDLEILKNFSKVIFVNFRPWVTSFPMWLGHLYGNCPITEVRRLILEDMEDEDKKDPHPLARDGHVGLHRRLALALGANAAELDDRESYDPRILSVIHSFFEFSRAYPWQEGLAAVMSSETTNVREIPQLYPDQLEFRDGKAAGAAVMWSVLKKLLTAGILKKEDAAFLFAHDWSLLDEYEGKPFDRAKGTEVKHVAYMIKALTEHTPPEKADNVVKMFRIGIQMTWVHFDAMGRLANEYLDQIGAEVSVGTV
jgi:pyrroloquinoline quinone (PQQ) biosynthesis protein C